MQYPSAPFLIREDDDRTSDDRRGWSYMSIGLGLFALACGFVVYKILTRFRKQRSRHNSYAQRQDADMRRSGLPLGAMVMIPPRAAGRAYRQAGEPHGSPPGRHPRSMAGAPSGESAERGQAAWVTPSFDVENLNTFEVTGEDGKNPCPICLGLLEEESVSTGQCLHLMHTSCLKSWLAKDVQSACPVCRVPYEDPAASGDMEAMRHGTSWASSAQDRGVPSPPPPPPQLSQPTQQPQQIQNSTTV